MGKISKGRGGQPYSSAHYTGVLAITYIGIPYIIVGFSQKKNPKYIKTVLCVLAYCYIVWKILH